MKRISLFFFLSILALPMCYSQYKQYLLVTFSIKESGYDSFFLLPIDSINMKKAETTSIYPFVLDENDSGWGSEHYKEQCLGSDYDNFISFPSFIYENETNIYREIKKNRVLVQTIKKRWYYKNKKCSEHLVRIYVTPVLAELCDCQLFFKQSTTLFYIVSKGKIKIDTDLKEEDLWKYLSKVSFSCVDYTLRASNNPFVYIQ